MRNIFYLLLMAGTVISCAPIRQRGDLENPMPFLADIGKYSGILTSSDFYKTGSPTVRDHLDISVTEVPFTKARFRKYLKLKKNKGERPTVAYIDSLPDKPKYLSLQIADMIAVAGLLNGMENQGVRSYLEKDGGYAIVSQVSLVAGPQQAQDLINADNIRLVEDGNGSLALQTIRNGSRTQWNISKMEVFDFATSGLCWEEDRSGKKKIGALTAEGEKCPNGTERKANKLDGTRSYLKLP